MRSVFTFYFTSTRHNDIMWTYPKCSTFNKEVQYWINNYQKELQIMFDLNNKPNDEQLKNILRNLSEYVKMQSDFEELPTNGRRISESNPLLSKPQHKITLDEFIMQVFIAMRDEFCGNIILGEKNSLYIYFSPNEIFKLHITKFQ